MPDLGNLLVVPPHAPVLLPRPDGAPQEAGLGSLVRGWELQIPSKKGRRGCKGVANGRTLEDHVAAWMEKKAKSGAPSREFFLPFLYNSPRMVECRLCRKHINAGEEVVCSLLSCQSSFHQKCAEQFGCCKSSKFKCPQHVCFLCKQRASWHCLRCMIAGHAKCCPWPDEVVYFTSQPTKAICWRHPKDWHLENEHAVSTSNIKEIFQRLPLPYIDEEFNVDDLLKDMLENEIEPAPYIHIKRNIYLVKKKRDDADVGGGCTNCDYRSSCGQDCECRSQSISCSKTCHCSSSCTNRPFRKEKKIKLVKTQFCGWGVEALEPISKGDFVIEYIGEVIDDAQCEQRLWDMKRRGDKNFYMCEIRKDFTIDATFKGNASRFLNHSCCPNCKLEKWQVEGETRVGVFASRAIAAGEPLTYDYRFEHFGPMVKCHCGAPSCRGYLGSQKKMIPINKLKSLACWGSKRKRTSMAFIDLIL